MQEATEPVSQIPIEDMFGHFYGIWGLRMQVLPLGDPSLANGTWSLCSYCTLLRKRLNYEDACSGLLRTKMAEAALHGNPIACECHGGLFEAFIPICNNGKVDGFIMIDPFRVADEPPKDIQDRWNRHFEPTEILEAYRQAPKIPSEQTEHIMGLSHLAAKHAVVRYDEAVRGSSVLRPVLKYMKENTDRNLSLSEVAAIVHRSPSTLTHLFQKILGKGFKQIQIEMKLERAEEMFSTTPHLTVREVSYRLGYQDPLYFSRLFKKYREISPSEYRTRRPSK